MDNQVTLRVANFRRYLFASLEILGQILAPVYILGQEYQLFELQSYSKLKITITGFIVLFAALLALRAKFLEWMKNWPTSVAKSIFDILLQMLPMAAFTALLLIAQLKVDDFIEVWWVVLGSYFLGTLFKQGHDYWLEYVIETRRANKWPRT